MLFEFIDVAYSFSIILLLIAILLVKKPYKQYINNCIAVSNQMLIFYSWYLLFQLYKLIQYILSLNLQIPEEAKEKPIDISWFHIKFLLLILLPYLFLHKKIADSKVLAIIILILLQWDVAVALYQYFIMAKNISGVLFYMPYLAMFKILSYISLFIALYALLWLLKRLPNQQVK
ncbi:MAG: hypothetical protein KF781_05345 [Chitinophagaceae bacterium]|nr:hypothetical protein [Chitinophagaceae bacterium]MCW5905943.1 hypothetical protein [Chitinophagaceae bacterium]